LARGHERPDAEPVAPRDGPCGSSPAELRHPQGERDGVAAAQLAHYGFDLRLCGVDRDLDIEHEHGAPGETAGTRVELLDGGVRGRHVENANRGSPTAAHSSTPVRNGLRRLSSTRTGVETDGAGFGWRAARRLDGDGTATS